MYQYHKQYKAILIDDQALKLTKKLEHKTKFWKKLIKNITNALTSAKIRNHGLADGDYPINQYISIRNEAFVKVGGSLVYPPNKCGYNAAGHRCPYLKLLAINAEHHPTRQQSAAS
jgi:hypothetical protein